MDLSACPFPGRGKDEGTGEKLRPNLLRAVTWAGTGFQTLQTAVCSESLLIPGLGGRLEPAGEDLLRGGRGCPGEVWALQGMT